jgi:hypothetical protein
LGGSGVSALGGSGVSALGGSGVSTLGGATSAADNLPIGLSSKIVKDIQPFVKGDEGIRFTDPSGMTNAQFEKRNGQWYIYKDNNTNTSLMLPENDKKQFQNEPLYNNPYAIQLAETLSNLYRPSVSVTGSRIEPQTYSMSMFEYNFPEGYEIPSDSGGYNVYNNKNIFVGHNPKSVREDQNLYFKYGMMPSTLDQNLNIIKR